MARERIGNFEIIRHLARGGMADVFLARVEGLEGFEKLCVLKRMLPELSTSDEHVRMFLDEARIAGALHHANIVQVYDVGIANGKYFLAMEYLPGQDLSKINKRLAGLAEQMPVEQVVHIVAAICAGLHHAHESKDPHGNPLGIVHRDISPQNVFVTHDGHVKLMDFGIAKASRRSTRTRSGVLKGKLGYMAPEQAMGEPLDRRADIYATAVILWELLTGRRLHATHNEYETIRAIVERTPPPPSAVRKDCPASLDGVVMRGLSKDASMRHPTALEMQHQLEAVAREARMTLATTSLAGFMSRLFPEGQDLSLTGANPVLRQATLVDDDEPADGSFAEGLSLANRSLPEVRDSMTTVPEPSMATRSALVSHAATADLERARAQRPVRFWVMAIAGLVAIAAIGVWATGAFRRPVALSESVNPVPDDRSAAAPTTRAPGSVPLIAGPSQPADSSASAVASLTPNRPPAGARPRPVKPPKPPAPKATTTWDYDSPLPP